jgi:non-heme chloroperoxidase
MNTQSDTRLYGKAHLNRRFDAISSDGARLAVQEWGRSDGPTLLLIHAWSQSHLGWAPQLQGDLAKHFRIVTFDHRGHGESDKPTAMEAYTENERWADDIHAVMEAAQIERAVLVPWSLGGVVALDYLAKYGVDRVAGVNFAAAGNAIGTARATTHFGAAVAAHAEGALSSDLRTQLTASLRLQQALVYREVPIEDFAELFGQALVAAPAARAGLLSRQIDHEPTLRALSLPLLLSHGTRDAILTPQASEDVLRFAPHAEVSWYEGGGHAPHWEDPERFDRELYEFAKRAFDA